VVASRRRFAAARYRCANGSQRFEEDEDMDAKRVDVKVFVADGARVDPAELIPVFHGWIQRSAVPDELLIDVADYDHVVDGPGVMLIGHQGQYGYDQGKGKDGLLYSQRRAQIDGGLREALAYTLRHALLACDLLEKEQALGGRLKFDGRQLQIRINDRLRAPNTPETWKAVEPDVRAVLGRVFGGEFTVQPAAPSGELFTLDVRAQKPESVEALLGRLAS
jgi:hypothetical protein